MSLSAQLVEPFWKERRPSASSTPLGARWDRKLSADAAGLKQPTRSRSSSHRRVQRPTIASDQKFDTDRPRLLLEVGGGADVEVRLGVSDLPAERIVYRDGDVLVVTGASAACSADAPLLLQHVEEEPKGLVFLAFSRASRMISVGDTSIAFASIDARGGVLSALATDGNATVAAVARRGVTSRTCLIDHSFLEG